MKRLIPITVIFLLIIFNDSSLLAQQSQTVPLPNIGINLGTSDNPDDIAVTLQLLLLLTILSLAPSILIMTTSYLRIIIVFHFLKNALGTQQMPPNQLLAGVALFITFFVMAPTWNEFHEKALKPYLDKEINIEEAYDKGIEPLRKFMLKNTRQEELKFFLELANMPRPNTQAELPIHVLIPSFVLSELRAGFIIGFFLFIPFVMVDMIVSSILMSMGMMMLPPMMISMPFKILLFVLVDGWSLVIGSVVRSLM
ncbi:MAG: flagellar type III secretion system pore protein FliP [Ignavibacteriae bacterium]|nr:flagellar type III secretion system pore protein FliP [Ignavibacteriota bacterium]MCB9206111.1 flagellar type III secretion system pore protein FliP [Ignavibacteriales bacterium]MCB9209384.1 flagellar type III secretion system pore protein FliP [Ignavibacteriales bacterium]MCB9258027.1 flagellar type III secretion system pore protein FliP [Ignavibacteriales bacterium]